MFIDAAKASRLPRLWPLPRFWPLPRLQSALETARPRARHRTNAATHSETARARAFLAAPPSSKIRLAIEDLETAERSSTYAIDMTTWHTPDPANNRCYVCLAGAVLAHRHPIEANQIYVGALPADRIEEFALDQRWDELLRALDEFRGGYVHAYLTLEGTTSAVKIAALVEANTEGAPFARFPGHIDYADDPAAFKSWARAIADKLEAAGC